MKKLGLMISAFFVVIFLLSITASASMLIPANDRAKERSNAPEKSPAIGENWDLERVDFIHYVKPGNPAKPSNSNSCYKLMGVKWNVLPVSYSINPLNSGLNESFVLSAISASAETWDSATLSELFNNAYSVDYSAVYGVYDAKNSVVFGDYPDSNVIGITSVWYMRKGRQIVEFDVMLNTDFAWGNSELSPAVMDVQNIMTHEFGHAVGLSDVYTSSCFAATMYGYSAEGEISKRTLEQPDINGLRSIYL